VISDEHEGIKAAAARVLNASWQRCRVHFMRNAMAYAGKTQRCIVSAWIGTAFAQDDGEAASKQWRSVADQLRPRGPKLAGLMQAAVDVLACTAFLKERRAKIHGTDALDKLVCAFGCQSVSNVDPGRDVSHAPPLVPVVHRGVPVGPPHKP
jgi:putative transposase